MHAGWTTFVLTATLVATGSLFAQQKHETAMSGNNMQNSDRSFITSAAVANLAEIDMAKLVGQKSTDPAVKDFANRMITDHTRASQKLATVAETDCVKLPLFRSRRVNESNRLNTSTIVKRG